MNVQASKRTKLAEQDGSLITNKEEFAIKQDDFFSNNVINLKNSKAWEF